VRLLWSQQISAPLRGLVLARECQWVLAWDAANWLHLFNSRGQRQAQVHLRGQLAAAACADDGRSFAAVSTTGQVWLLAPDLMPHWERSLDHPATTLALASLGEYVAVAGGSGSLQFYAADGKRVWTSALPRPLKHLAFVPGKPLLVGCADFGLVACVDAGGKVLWRDGLVANAGSLACANAGKPIAAACYSDGLWCYDLTGQKRQRFELAPCRLAALSYTGDVILTADLERTVRVFNREGTCLATQEMEDIPIALALAPLGDAAWVALQGGRIEMLRIGAQRD
jgi:PQQ-like domain